MISEAFNIDCIIGMKKYPDKYFSLAIVDPPYGINADVTQNDLGGKKGFTKMRELTKSIIKLIGIMKYQMMNILPN